MTMPQPKSDHHGDDERISTDPKEVGQWETITDEFANAATHVALLPTNKILAYGGSSLDPDEFKKPTLPLGQILDLNVEPPQVYQMSQANLHGDLWCGGHTLLEDGKLLFVGGTSFYPPPPDPIFGGLREAYLFDPWRETWERLDDMQEGRWYPTLIRLADNSVLVIGGFQFRDPEAEPATNLIKIIFDLFTKMQERIVKVQEVYHHDSQEWGIMKDERDFPLYPRLHLLPDGDVFYSGVFNTHYFVPGRFPSARWNQLTGEWTDLGGRHRKKNREEGISLLLALRPPNYEPKILVAGGGTHNLGRILMTIFHSIHKESWSSKFHFLTKVQDSAELIDLSQSEPRWQAIARMHFPRIHAPGVLLPDGQVAAIGGMSAYGHIPGTHMAQHPVLPAEMYDPDRNAWTLMAAQSKPRVYHSTAILLPDARVISMGSNPYAKMIEHAIEIYSPPYLFRGDRPVISQPPERMPYETPVSIRVNQARQIGQVVLMRPEVLTHVTNTDQRLLELEFKAINDDTLEIQGPPTAAHMPEGYSLLFVLNNDGVPSVGKFVRVG
jgi:Galactose oxidase-like, Early set domain